MFAWSEVDKTMDIAAMQLLCERNKCNASGPAEKFLKINICKMTYSQNIIYIKISRIAGIFDVFSNNI